MAAEAAKKISPEASCCSLSHPVLAECTPCLIAVLAECCQDAEVTLATEAAKKISAEAAQQRGRCLLNLRCTDAQAGPGACPGFNIVQGLTWYGFVNG